MIEALFNGLVGIFLWPAFGYMLIGIAIGFVVGILPGLGGITALSLMLPFTFVMKPIEAFAFLLGMQSVVATTGDITSILFGIPGEPIAAALVLDGYPMTKKGQAGRALGANLMSSLIGSWFGALVLALSIPIIRPLVLSFGPPELFVLTLLGVTFLSSMWGGSRLKSFIAGGFGFLLSMIGMDPQSGVLRYTFKQVYLLDGLNLVPVAVGIFGIPEVIDLAVKGSSIAETQLEKLGGIMEGIKDNFRHFWLVIRCSAIGTFLGIVPGLGASVSQWVAYGHAVQTSRNKERFGKGAIEGILGPGACNNSKEGGALIPTVVFGVPSSPVMAVLLGAFVIIGLVPGPDMLTKHLSVTFSMMWCIVVANLITVGMCLLFLNQLVKLTFVKGTIIIPFILLLVWLGAFTANNQFDDLVVALIFGVIGWAMVKLGWPRPSLLFGLVLGPIAENNLYISIGLHGANWLTRPVVLVVLMLCALSIFLPYWKNLRERFRRA